MLFVELFVVLDAQPHDIEWSAVVGVVSLDFHVSAAVTGVTLQASVSYGVADGNVRLAPFGIVLAPLLMRPCIGDCAGFRPDVRLMIGEALLSLARIPGRISITKTLLA